MAFGIAFLVVTLVHLYSCFMAHDKLRRSTKPFVLLLLALFYLSTSSPMPLIVAALLLGMMGDIFLLAPKKSAYFIAGMISFFLGHVCYIIALLDGVTLAPPYLIAVYIVAIGIIIYMTLKRIPKLPKVLSVAVPIYALMLSSLGLVALLALVSNPGINSSCVFLGAALFMLSDSILLTHIFKGRFKNSNFFVMLTYVFAQAFIVAGVTII